MKTPHMQYTKKSNTTNSLWGKNCLGQFNWSSPLFGLHIAMIYELMPSEVSFTASVKNPKARNKDRGIELIYGQKNNVCWETKIRLEWSSLELHWSVGYELGWLTCGAMSQSQFLRSNAKSGGIVGPKARTKGKRKTHMFITV